jgi:hypothetical protein
MAFPKHLLMILGYRRISEYLATPYLLGLPVALAVVRRRRVIGSCQVFLDN